MKCAKCGTLISEGSTSCTGCNTPISELVANNLLIKENKENSQTEVINISNQAPVVDIAPVPPVDVILENPAANTTEPKIEEVPSIVEIAPVVEKPVVEIAPVVEKPVVEVAPVVESTPVVENTQEVNELKSENVQVTRQEEPGKESTLISDNNTIINSVVTEVTPTTASQPTQTPGETQMTDAPEVKEKGKGKVLIAIVVGVVLLIVGVVLGFMFLTNKPSSMFKTSISLVRSKLNSVENEKPAKASLTFQTNLSTKDAKMQATYDKLNKLYLETSTYTDVKNGIVNMDLLMKYGEKSLLNVNMFTENNKSYIKLNDVYDKYLLTETEDALETKDLMTIVDGYMLAFEESLKEEYFTKEEKTIKINNEDVKVNASTLKIDSTNISTLVTDIFTKLKSNNEFMTAYAKLQDITKEEAIKEMDDSISSLSDTSTWTEEMKGSLNYQITVYTKGLLNTPVGVGITSDKITYTMYFTEENIIVYQTMEGKETKVLDVSINGNKYNVNMYVGEEVLSFIVGYSVEENPTFTKPDTSNSVKMEELTQEDTMNITMALMGSEGMQSLTSDFAAELQMLQMLLPSMGIGGDTPSTEMMEDTTSFQNMNSGITLESNATMSDDVTTGLNNFVFE